MSKKSYFLNGEKVGLRGMEREDLYIYKNWLNDKKVTRFLEMGWRPYTEKDLETMYQEAIDGQNAVVFVACDLKTHQPIGTAGLYLINWPGRRAQYRILIGDSSYFGKGCGTEINRLVVGHGFDRMNLNTIYLGVNAENKGAVKSYEKAGFIHDGVHRDFVYNNGRYYDSLAMSILKSDYEKISQANV
jgi:RimJ/RimL family protein N-acetyltransferase